MVRQRPLTAATTVGYSNSIKRLFDVVFVLLSLPFLLPALIIISLIVWLADGHPPIFKQTRYGKHGNPFRIYKFRTMIPDAPRQLADVKHLNEAEWPIFKLKSDPRATNLGRFLRRSSLDELPQLFNVLKGEMSLVGPRPNSFSPTTYPAAWQLKRLEALPGLTGLWAVEGRSLLTFEEWAKLDIIYIENQNLWFDLKILWRTVSVVLQAKGAY